MTTPSSAPVPVLLAGDQFVLNRLLAEDLAAAAGADAWELRELEFPWPTVPFGQVAEVDEAGGDEDGMVAAEADRYRRGEPPAHCANPEVLTEVSR